MYAKKRGYPWPVATSSFRMLANFNTTLQSTKVAFDSDGMIVYRGELGQRDEYEWRQVFAKMKANDRENRSSARP